MAAWRRSTTGVWACLGLWLFVGGCGDDGGRSTTPPPIPVDGGADPDTGTDAGTPGDAAAADASEDATTPGGDDGGAGSCTFTGDDLRDLQPQNLDLDEPPALAVRHDGLLFGWVETAHPQAPAPLAMQWWSLDLEMPSAVTVTEVSSVQRDPVAVATGDGYLVVWRDDRGGSLDLLARPVTAEGDVPEGAPVQVTDDAEDDGPPALARKASHVLVAWVRDGQGYTRLLAADGTPLQDERQVAGLGAAVGPPALAAIETGYALAWVEADGRVWLQALDANGEAQGSPARADAEGNAVGPVTAASMGEDGGALVFDVRVDGDRAEVRFRPFDGSATPVLAEEPITVSGERGQASAVVSLLGGYAAAYRGTTDGVAGESLRFVLLDDRGRRLQPPIPLDDTSSPPTFTAMGASPDGRTVIVAWTDAAGRFLARIACE